FGVVFRLIRGHGLGTQLGRMGVLAAQAQQYPACDRARDQKKGREQDGQATDGLGSNVHDRLTFPNMIDNVLKMITRSSQKVRFSTYSMSYLIHSWKSLPRRRVR